MGTTLLRVLGRPSVEVDGAPAAISTMPLQLVIRLGLAAPAVVTVASIRNSLWPDHSSESAVRVNVTRARSRIGSDRIVAVGQAYGLVDVDVDAREFESLVGDGRDAEHPIEDRVARYDDALALWSGPAFDGIADLPWLAGEAQALDELREQAVDERAGLLLEAGANERVVSALWHAADRHPLREDRCRLLALALYRSGRQAEALAVIARTRRELRDQLGLIPGEALQDLERRVLAHDPALEQPPSSDAAEAAFEIEAAVNAAATLMQAEVFEEAQSILSSAEQRAAAIRDSASEARVLLARAQLAMRTGAVDPHPLIDRAQRLARELRDGRLLARAALTRVGAGVPDDMSGVLVELTEPIALLDESDPEQVELLCMAAIFVVLIDAPEASQRLLEEAERRHAQLGTPRTEILLLAARSTVRSVTADGLGQAERDAERAIELARSTGEPSMVVTALQPALRANYLQGRLADVDGMLDELAALAGRASLPYGLVRAELGRASNALARGALDLAEARHAEAQRLAQLHRTYAAGRAMSSQALLLAWERDRLAPLLGVVAAQAEQRGPSVWHAVAAVCGDEAIADRLADVAGEVPRDASFLPFCALAAEVAARRGDARLAGQVIEPLDAIGDRAVLVGFGTVVLGFASHFAGLASAASGDLVGAERRLAHARSLARSAGAALWEAHSAVELAGVLAAGPRDGRSSAAAILTGVRGSAAAQASARLVRRIDAVDRAIREATP